MKYYLISLLLFLALLPSCTNYNVGDISKAYCSSVTPENRAALNALANAAGLTMSDYCASLGVPLIIASDLQELLTDAPK